MQYHTNDQERGFVWQIFWPARILVGQFRSLCSGKNKIVCFVFSAVIFFNSASVSSAMASLFVKQATSLGRGVYALHPPQLKFYSHTQKTVLFQLRPAANSLEFEDSIGCKTVITTATKRKSSARTGALEKLFIYRLPCVWL